MYITKAARIDTAIPDIVRNAFIRHLLSDILSDTKTFAVERFVVLVGCEPS
jgi:hypothetical protein